MAIFSCLRGENDSESGVKSSFLQKMWRSLKRKFSPRARRERKALKKLMAEVEKEKERERNKIEAVEMVVEDIKCTVDEVVDFFLQTLMFTSNIISFLQYLV